MHLELSMQGTGNWKGSLYHNYKWQLDYQQWSTERITFLPNLKHLLREMVNLSNEMTVNSSDKESNFEYARFSINLKSNLLGLGDAKFCLTG